MQIFYLFCKKILFLFYISTFTKHPHQFIYSIHLFNKIFILFYIFYYFLPSGTNSQTRLLRRATPTPSPSQPPFNKIRRATPTPNQPSSFLSSYKPNINPKSPTSSHQPLTTISDQIEQTRRNHSRSLSQGLGSLDHGPLRKSIVFV